MAKANIGDRVGAVLFANEKEVALLGYGTYAGDEIPTTAVGFMADTAREIGITNPKIVLDNGKIVWGMECWWGSEEAVKSRIEVFKENGAEIKDTDIDKVREEYLKQIEESKEVTV